MKKQDKAACEILTRLKLAASRELGPEAAKRFASKVDALKRELQRKPRNDIRLRKAIDGLIVRLLKRVADAGE